MLLTIELFHESTLFLFGLYWVDSREGERRPYTLFGMTVETAPDAIIFDFLVMIIINSLAQRKPSRAHFV